MSEVSLPAGLPLTTTAQPSAPASKVKQTAAEFEALLIAQMLQSARSSASLTSLDGEGNGSKDSVMDFAEQQLSSTLASAGGLGLATLVAQGLNQPGRAAEAPVSRPADAK